jgi:hypothetical protein
MSATDLAQNAPERSLAQRMAALDRGNAIRSHRARLKREMKVGTGKRSAADVLAAPLEEELSMKVVDLLLAIPKVGRVKANKWLVKVRASPSKTIGGISSRQREELLAIVGRGRP